MNGITGDGAKALASAPPAVKLERFGGVCVFEGEARD